MTSGPRSRPAGAPTPVDLVLTAAVLLTSQAFKTFNNDIAAGLRIFIGDDTNTAGVMLRAGVKHHFRLSCGAHQVFNNTHTQYIRGQIKPWQGLID